MRMRRDLQSIAGRLLHRQLPEEHRYRDPAPDPDELGDLEAYLHGMGGLLDLIRGTLEQLHADGFAEPAEDGREIQGWLIPYLAELVGAELRSPDEKARRRELDRSVAWYQGKGTLATVDEIADTIAGVETVTVEGWRRTLVTPRPDLPPFSIEKGAAGPARAPLGTPDLRRHDRAVLDPMGDDPVMALRSPGHDQEAPTRYWRHLAPGGAPCFPGHFDDGSARMPDLRDPAQGPVGPHPQRIHVHVRPPYGFFAPGLEPLQAAGADPLGLAAGDDAVIEIGPMVAMARLGVAGAAPDRLGVDGDLTIPAGRTVTFTDLLLLGTVTVEPGAVLRLERAAVRQVLLPPAGEEPALDARHALLDSIDGDGGFARLEFATVLGDVAVQRLQASDCIFAGTVDSAVCDDAATCLRFSRLPPDLATHTHAGCFAHAPHNTTDRPRFVVRPCGPDTAPELREPRFGEPGAGVLHHAASARIRQGSELGGEIGAYHHLFHAASLDALARKLAEFLPMGQELVLLHDERLAAGLPTVT